MRPLRALATIAPVTLMLVGAGCSSVSAPDGAEPTRSADPLLATSPHWDELRDLNLAQQAEALEVDVPDAAEFIEYIHPDSFGRVRSQCIRDQGFDASETFDNGVSYGPVPDEQGEALRRASILCAARYPVHPRFFEPETEEQLRIIYDYHVNELVPCLEREGYDVGEVPSWMPYNAVVDEVMPQPDLWQAINEACPQNPPIERLFGSSNQ